MEMIYFVIFDLTFLGDAKMLPSMLADLDKCLQFK